MNQADYTLYGDAESLDMQRATACIQLAGMPNRHVSCTVQSVPTSNDYYGPGTAGAVACSDKRNLNLKVCHGRAVGRYVLSVEGSPLMPYRKADQAENEKLTADFENACAVEAYDFDPIATGLLKEAKAKKAGKDHDAARFAKLQKDFKELLKTYQFWLQQHENLVANILMAPDVFHLPMIRALNEYPETIAVLQEPGYDKVAAWWKRIAALQVRSQGLAF